MRLGLNDFGQPVYQAEVAAELGLGKNLMWDAPTELDLTKDGTRGMVTDAADMPYSVAELEHALRMYDADAGALPKRLYDLARLFDEPVNRLRITTDSNDLPVPNFEMPSQLLGTSGSGPGPGTGILAAQGARMPQSVAELIEARVRYQLNKSDAPNFKKFGDPTPLAGPVTDATTPAGKVRAIVRQLLAPELAAGQRLDVNRPLGNGRDDNNNGVVDEPGETDATGQPEPVWPSNLTGAGAATAALTAARFTPLDADGDGVSTFTKNDGTLPDAVLQRQLLARNLYVLALTMTAPLDYDPGQFGATNPSAAQKDHQALARRLAQWAVNVVDFRDADNIMTPFEYDMNPFDGWDVDGDLRTVKDHDPDGSLKADLQNVPHGPDTGDETVVWGAERPELVMTETLAWHDRRTDDSGQADAYPAQDGPDQLMHGGDPLRADKDFDQLVRPRGAFFVELYNPWPTNPSANADTHALTIPGSANAPPSGWDSGVDLARTHDGTSNGSPVWRMAVYKRATERKTYTEAQAEAWDPDDPDPAHGLRSRWTAVFTSRPPTPTRPTATGTGTRTAADSSLIRMRRIRSGVPSRRCAPVDSW